ncbi:hypothetical protein Nepgr_018648 [Nepenthes gracilis]|uniref:Uncharacterized protein n=1 Tax=Nepenthes gracilis TaxID=150966 RepID=A0AAD3STG5_NEPGR|nr:hypothetical protein Nepgr_018648 [Nepenthes gracilis]
MAKISRAQELAALKSDNENLRTLNARLLRDSMEKKRGIADLLESKKDSVAKMHEMKVELEALHRSAAESHRRTLWTLAISGAAIFATAAASVAYFSR